MKLATVDRVSKAVMVLEGILESEKATDWFGEKKLVLYVENS